MIHVLMHVESEPLGTFEKVLKEKKIAFRYYRLHQEEALPADIPEGDALIVMGGPMSAYDLHPAIGQEVALIRKALQSNRPVLGICLGAQLMAKALGARVYPALAGEVGCSTITVSSTYKQGTVFEDFDDEFIVFQWHNDTFDIPGQARRIARGLLVPNQAFQYGRKSFGVQFHLEVTAEMVKKWMEEHPEDLQKAGIDNQERLLMTADAHSFSLEIAAKKMMTSFLKLGGLIPS